MRKKVPGYSCQITANNQQPSIVLISLPQKPLFFYLKFWFKCTFYQLIKLFESMHLGRVFKLKQTLSSLSVSYQNQPSQLPNPNKPIFVWQWQRSEGLFLLDAASFFLWTDLVIELNEDGHAMPQDYGEIYGKNQEVLDLLQHFDTTYSQRFDENPPEQGSVISSMTGEMEM